MLVSGLMEDDREKQTKILLIVQFLMLVTANDYTLNLTITDEFFSRGGFTELKAVFFSFLACLNIKIDREEDDTFLFLNFHLLMKFVRCSQFLHNLSVCQINELYHHLKQS